MATNVEKNMFLAAYNIFDQARQGQGPVNMNYVQKVYKGLRENVPQLAFPSIFIEPHHTQEKVETTNRRALMICQFRVVMFAKHHNWDVSIDGDANGKGIYDFVDDVKNVLMNYPDLNWDSTVIRANYIRFPSTTYRFDHYPFRVADMILEAYLLLSSATAR